jgi:hypothetical protein
LQPQAIPIGVPQLTERRLRDVLAHRHGSASVSTCLMVRNAHDPVRIFRLLERFLSSAFFGSAATCTSTTSRSQVSFCVRPLRAECTNPPTEDHRGIVKQKRLRETSRVETPRGIHISGGAR